MNEKQLKDLKKNLNKKKFEAIIFGVGNVISFFLIMLIDSNDFKITIIMAFKMLLFPILVLVGTFIYHKFSFIKNRKMRIIIVFLLITGIYLFLIGCLTAIDYRYIKNIRFFPDLSG